MRRHEHLIPVKPFIEVVEKQFPRVDLKKRNYIQLQVYYQKDGKRGIYMSASPLSIEETTSPGLVMRSFPLWRGARLFIEEAARLNQKRVTALFDEAVADYNAKRGPAWCLVAQVLESNEKELEPNPEGAALVEVPCT